MIVGKYNFDRLNDFDQVCLCCVLRNRAKSINMVSPVAYTQKMWTNSIEDGFKLTEDGRKFLRFCKKAENKLINKEADIEYSRAFDAVINESRKCGKQGMIEKFLYYTEMDFDTAKSQGDVIKQDDMWKLTETAQDILLIKSILGTTNGLFEDEVKQSNVKLECYLDR